MDKRKYIALSLEEERRSTRPRLNNHNSNASTAPSKPKPNNSSNNNPASQPVNNNSPDQNVKEDPFKQVQGDELEDGDDDDDDDDGVKRPVNAKRAGRRKIKIEYIQEKSRRHITFSKRKSGIMKKVLFSFLVSVGLSVGLSCCICALFMPFVNRLSWGCLTKGQKRRRKEEGLGSEQIGIG